MFSPGERLTQPVAGSTLSGVTWRLRGLATLAAVAGASALVVAPARGDAVAYQADSAHSGYVAAGPNPPLGRKWIRRDLGLQVSYPVIAEGKVFVTAYAPSANTSNYGSSRPDGPTYLHALDRDTGGTVWVRQVAAHGLPAYGDGRVYVSGADSVDAVSAATGERVWRADLRGGAGVAPVADGAFVYASDMDGAHALSADTGIRVQSRAGLRGAAFTVVEERVFLAQSGCATIAAFTRGLAQQIWSRSGPCSSGASVPAAFHTLGTTPPNERLWARQSDGLDGLVVDALTSLGSEEFVSEGGIALAGEHAFLRLPSAIQARSQSSGVIAWSAAPATQLRGSALAVRDAVWTTTGQGELVALRRSDGGELFRTPLITHQLAPASHESTFAAPHSGMAADERGLLVPYVNRLVALGPGADTPGIDDPDKIPAGTTTLSAAMRTDEYELGRAVQVTGQVTSGDDEVGGHQLELQADPYPYGVWETVDRATSESFRGYTLTHRPDRNTRYRVVDTSTAPAVESKTLQAWVFPKVRLRLGYRGTGRVYVSSSMTVPDYLPLNGKPLYVYRLRNRNAVGVRIGSIKIKRVKGNSYRARRTLRVPSHRPRTDYFFICFKLPDTRQLTRLNGRKFGCGRSRF